MEIITESIYDITESQLDREWRNMKFCAEMVEQHREMERFVNESLVLASGNKRAINEMYIITEAAFGDKIKRFFEKIKNFFKKIFDKLGASLNGLFLEQKKYMDKYANIITKCKWKSGDISDIKDRFKGLPRIIEAVDNADTAVFGILPENMAGLDEQFSDRKINTSIYASADEINKAYNDEKNRTRNNVGDMRDEVYNKFISDGNSYWSKVEGFTDFKKNDSNGNVDINGTFRDWFDGSVDTVTYSEEEVDTNFQAIINVSYAGASYIKKLEKLVTSVTRKMDTLSKAFDDYYKEQQTKINNAIKNSPTEKNAALEEEKQASKAVADASGNSQSTEETYSPVGYSSYVNELTFNKPSTSDSKDSGTIQSGIGTTQNANAQKAIDSVNKKDVGKLSTTDVKTDGINKDNKSDIEKKAQELIDTDVFNKQTLINEEINVSSTIVRKMFDAFKNTNSDFFKIIKAHVQWYLSNPGESDKSENQTTRPKSLNLNAGSESVQKNNPSTEKAEETPEQGDTETRQRVGQNVARIRDEKKNKAQNFRAVADDALGNRTGGGT